MPVEVTRIDDASETWHRPTNVWPNGYCESADIPFLVNGAAHRVDAIAAVMAQAPDTYNGIQLKQVRFDDWQNGIATVTAIYTRDEQAQEDDEEEPEPTLNYECGGGTKHMTHAYEQHRVYGGSNDDADGMIGWNGKSGTEAEYSGVDVPCADMRLSYTKSMRVRKATDTSYMKTVAHCVGMVNNDEFKGWAAGELMFLGASFSTPVEGAETVVVTFNFRAMPNESECIVAGHNVGSKKGFEYMWARSEAVADGDTGKTKNKVVGIYKSRVCLRTNFHKLGI